MDSPLIAPAPLNRRLPDKPASIFRALLVLGLIVYGWILGTNIAAVAGGSDTSGYYNQALLLSAGRTHVAPRVIDGFAPFQQLWVYAPLGFKPAPAGTDLIPTYPTGLPLWIALAAKFVGWESAGNAAIWLHALAGVVLMFIAGRTFGLSRGTALTAAAILGTSPVYLFIAVQTMSDVPALVWVLAAVICAWRSARSAGWAFAAGAAFAVAVLIRPTDALVLAPLAIALGMRPRSWAAFAAGGIPGALYFCWYNHGTYGGWLTTGYGELALDRKWVGMTLRHYAIWLPVVFSPVVFGLLLWPWAMSGRGRIFALFSAWFLTIAGFYSAYNCTHETWWYLRFLLPAAPALILASLIPIKAILDRISQHAARKLGLALVILAVSWNIAWSRHWNLLHAGQEEVKYGLTSRWLQQRVPPNAVVACMQQSGALFYDTHFTLVRWDYLDRSDFDALTRALAKQGRPLYAVLFPFEIDSDRAFEQHMPSGHWEQCGRVHELTIWKWSPTAVR